MKKAIFIDLDGSLLPEGELHKVSDFNIDMLKKAQEEKIYTIISTGRGIEMVNKVHEQINFSDYSRYLITLNGGRVYDLKDDKEL
jgi:HAD superfamily hydrolase (TIGR01484 family)